MHERAFGRTGRRVSELGVGMWGMGGWTGSDDRQSMRVLQAAVDAGATFFNSALAYGAGHSDRLLGDLFRANPGHALVAATKVPPLNRQWPSRRGDPIANAFPAAHIRSSVEASLRQMKLPALDLVQFHVWEDDWADDEGWQRAIEDLRRDGLVRHVGISINRWEASNGIRTVRTGLVDAVQVIYNVFEQAPDDGLFPACRELGVAVIARVPFDEGSLIGSLTVDSRWPEGDWRNTYFVPGNLRETVPRVEALRALVPVGSSLAEVALRFILSNPAVTTVIPGMRRIEHLEANVAAAAAGPLPADLLDALRRHRWDRQPTHWSQ